MPPYKVNRWQHYCKLALPGFVLAGTIAALVMANGVTRKPNVYSLRNRLVSADEVDIPSVVDKLLAAGAPGFVELIAATDPTRPQVTRATTAAIERQLIEWESAPIKDRSAVAVEVAAALSKRAEEMNIAALSLAASVSERMLAWRVELEIEARNDFVAHCEAVMFPTDQEVVAMLESIDPNEIDAVIRPRSEMATASPTAFAAKDQKSGSTKLDTAKSPTADDDLLSAIGLPGGDLPVVVREAPTTVAIERAAPPEENRSREPRLLLDGELDDLPTAPLIPPPDVRRRRDAADGNSDVREVQQSNAKTAAREGKNGVQQTAASEELLTVDRERSLLRLLSGPADVADEAERALRAAGYDDASLDVARRATHEDRGVRLRLAEGLPAMRNVSARQWLEFLLDDEEAGVRRAAFSQLATIGDRALMERLRKRAAEDEDEGIRRLGERLK